jgi:hypothetical protein
MILKLIPKKPQGEIPMAYLCKDKKGKCIGAIHINNLFKVFGINVLPEEIEVNIHVSRK